MIDVHTVKGTLRKALALIAPVLLVAWGQARAGEVEIVQVNLSQHGASWSAAVTLQHADTGWDHYADAWRVVAPDGRVLGTRTLYHPHVNEQPFTRNLGNIEIPADLPEVVVEAHDKVHGWSSQRIRVDLRQSQGERFRVER